MSEVTPEKRLAMANSALDIALNNPYGAARLEARQVTVQIAQTHALISIAGYIKLLVSKQ